MKLNFTDKWLNMALKTLKWYDWYRNDLKISLIWKKWYILKHSYFFFTCILELLRPSKSTLKLSFLLKENLECKYFDVFWRQLTAPVNNVKSSNLTKMVITLNSFQLTLRNFEKLFEMKCCKSLQNFKSFHKLEKCTWKIEK